MSRKIVSAIMLSLLIVSILTLAFKVQLVKADDGTIYINADGSITPSTAPIYNADNVTYTLTGDITAVTDGIDVERGNIVLDGAGYTLIGNGSGIGIMLTDVSNVALTNLTAENFTTGICLVSSYSNTLSGIVLSGNIGHAGEWYSYGEGTGIYLDSSSNNCVFGNNMTNNFEGIFLYFSSNYNNVSENNMTDNLYTGIALASSDSDFTLNSSSNNNISGNNITGNVDGYSLFYCPNNNFSENCVMNNSRYGIALYSPYSANNGVTQNNITQNGEGISLDTAYYNSFIGNNITNNSWGIDLGYACNNYISDNNVADTRCNGISLAFSSDSNNIIGNNITNSSIEGINLNNACSNNTISGNNITENGSEMQDDSWSGIDIYSCSNNSITRNNVLCNGYGISLECSSENNFLQNNVTENAGFGIWLFSSFNNSFGHNCFVDNNQQVYSDGSPNIWDDGYPSGGNYWSDYNGTDSYSGPHQNLAGSDGIGDTPYVIDANNTDHYPLMPPSALPLHLVGDLNGDGKVDLADLVLLANAYGSHCANYHYQGESTSPNWNPNAELAPPYGIIGLADLVTLATHYGEYYP